MLIRSIILFLFSISTFVFGQQDSCNKLNAEGKKIGYWKVFLNENALPTDSSNSFFWGYQYYDNGNLTFDVFYKEKKRFKTESINFEGETTTKGNPKAISGIVIKSYYKKDKKIVLSEYKYVNGYPELFREYLSGRLCLIIDFTKKYNNLNGTFYLTDYSNKHKTTCFWYRKLSDKWQSVETSCE
jgi:hypothetical protein